MYVICWLLSWTESPKSFTPTGSRTYGATLLRLQSGRASPPGAALATLTRDSGLPDWDAREGKRSSATRGLMLASSYCP